MKRKIIKYWKDVDVLDICVKEGKYEYSEEVADGVILDIGKDGEILSIEILNATKRMDELRVDGKLIVIEDVPAKVCENCGEKYFSAKVSKQIDVLLESTGEAKRTPEVPVFSLKALKATG